MKKLGKHKTNDVSYTFQAPTGVPGDVTRVDQSNVEAAMLIAAGGVFAQSFGIPVKYVSGGIQQFNGGAETAPDFAGVLIRQAPGISGSITSDSALGGVPNGAQVQGLLVRGYCNVICAHGTPARGGVVYVQIIANGGVPVGAFRADADGGNTIALTADQAEWAVDGKDAFNNSELRVQR